MSKFDLGRLTVTRGVSDKISSDLAFYKFVIRCISRHESGDWGDCYVSDKKLNDESLASGNDRLFSVYAHADHPDWKIWIITEWDRSATTVLFPDEY